MIVVDANVAVIAYVPGPLRDEARAMIVERAGRLIVPDLFYGEVANAIARLVRTRRMSAAEGRIVVDDVNAMFRDRRPTTELVRGAFELALRYNHGVFDMLYLNVARAAGAVFVTADEVLVSKLRSVGLTSSVVPLAGWRATR